MIPDLITPMLHAKKWSVIYCDSYAPPEEPPVLLSVWETKEEAEAASKKEPDSRVYPPKSQY